MPPTNAEIAETYLAAYRSKDPGRALLAPKVTLQYPLSPRKIVGREQVVEYMLSVLPGFEGVEIERHILDGDYVVTLWKALTVWGTMPACSVFRIAGGLIVEIRSFFDPRPILQRDGGMP
jgi:limonene-1,2-epoxide hydrolase